MQNMEHYMQNNRQICKILCKICNFFKLHFVVTYMQNMQNNMHNMQNMQIKKPIFKICTAQVADDEEVLIPRVAVNNLIWNREVHYRNRGFSTYRFVTGTY